MPGTLLEKYMTQASGTEIDNALSTAPSNNCNKFFLPSKLTSTSRRTRPREVIMPMLLDVPMSKHEQQTNAQSDAYPNDISELQHATKSAEQTRTIARPLICPIATTGF